MKKTFLGLLALCIASPCFARWTTSGNNIYNSNAGNIGIGTTSPSYKLHINGNDLSMGLINGTINSSNNTGETSIFFGDASSGVKMLRASKKTYNTRAFEIWSEYGFNNPSLSAEFHHDYINFSTADVKRMTIDAQGNIGIGTTTSDPASKLVVAGGATNNTIDQTVKLAQFNGNTSFGGYIGQRIVSGNTRQGLIVSGSGSLTLNAGLYNMDFINGAINSSTDANLAMRITATGKVGIGTSSPDEKLTVNGKIHATEVRIDVSFPAPDYVFETDYHLLSLPETEKYIQVNKHLPEVQSAEEISREGINVSEMQMILLRKVEELTLHLIEKDKQLQAQQKQINSLIRNQQKSYQHRK